MRRTLRSTAEAGQQVVLIPPAMEGASPTPITEPIAWPIVLSATKPCQSPLPMRT